MTGARVIDAPRDSAESWLLNTFSVTRTRPVSGCPEVAVYDSPDVNAFATGASRNTRSSRSAPGLLRSLGPQRGRGRARPRGHAMSLTATW